MAPEDPSKGPNGRVDVLEADFNWPLVNLPFRAILILSRLINNHEGVMKLITNFLTDTRVWACVFSTLSNENPPSSRDKELQGEKESEKAIYVNPVRTSTPGLYLIQMTPKMKYHEETS